MPIYPAFPIRLEADLISNPPVAPVDASTGLPIQFYRQQGLTFQVGIFDAYGNAVDLSNLSYLQLIIQQSATSLVPNVVSQVNAGAIIPTISRADWRAGIAQQATFTLSNAQTDLSLGGAASASYWIALVGVTTANANIVYAAGPITVFNGGNLPYPPPSGFVSDNDQTNGGGAMVVTPGAQIHTEGITITGAAGTRTCVVQAANLIAGALVDIRFLLPATAGINIQVFDQSTSGNLLTTISSAADGFTPSALVMLRFDGANFQRKGLLIPSFGQQS